MPNTECEFSVSLETKILVFLGLIKDGWEENLKMTT